MSVGLGNVLFNVSMTQNEEEEDQNGSPDIAAATNEEEIVESTQE